LPHKVRGDGNLDIRPPRVSDAPGIEHLHKA
jgi:hypothetical protein